MANIFQQEIDNMNNASVLYDALKISTGDATPLHLPTETSMLYLPEEHDKLKGLEQYEFALKDVAPTVKALALPFTAIVAANHSILRFVYSYPKVFFVRDENFPKLESHHFMNHDYIWYVDTTDGEIWLLKLLKNTTIFFKDGIPEVHGYPNRNVDQNKIKTILKTNEFFNAEHKAISHMKATDTTALCQMICDRFNLHPTVALKDKLENLDYMQKVKKICVSFLTKPIKEKQWEYPSDVDFPDDHVLRQIKNRVEYILKSPVEAKITSSFSKRYTPHHWESKIRMVHPPSFGENMTKWISKWNEAMA